MFVKVFLYTQETLVIILINHLNAVLKKCILYFEIFTLFSKADYHRSANVNVRVFLLKASVQTKTVTNLQVPNVFTVFGDSFDCVAH